MTNSSDIGLIAAQLCVGETVRSDCPSCNGHKTLSVTCEDDGTVLYNCFKAKCDFKGSTKTDFIHSTKTFKKVVPRRKEIVTSALSLAQASKLKELYGITDTTDIYANSQYGSRVAFPIWNPVFVQRGWLLRDITGTAKTKALTFVDHGQQGMSWYRNFCDGPTIVVEDIPSAIRASKYMNAVALLGTGIGLDRALEIRDNATKPVVMALDQDATELSFKWARKHKLLWGDVMVLPLPKDLKNMSEPELIETLSDVVDIEI